MDINLTGDTYGRQIEASPADWAKSCGACHVGGGQLEYDRTLNPYSSNSPAGDRYTYVKPHINPQTGEVVAGGIYDISQIPELQATELFGSNNAEIDCMLCHSNDPRPMAAWYKSMGCGQGGVPGPKTDPNCSGEIFNFSPGNIYDIYNRNLVLLMGRYNIAATAGLGVPINPMTGETVIPTPQSISGAIIAKPSGKNCAQCHARDEDTIGLPGMAAMLAGFGNYARITMPGYGFDFDEISSSGACNPSNPDRDCKNNTMWFELGCKTGMGKRAQKTGTGSSDKFGPSGMCIACEGLAWSQGICLNQTLKGYCQMLGVSIDNNPMNDIGKTIPNKMPDTDVHDAKNMRCADCHYSLEGTIPGKTYSGVTYPDENIQKIDHQFAQGYSTIEKSKDNLDGTVTCAGCHITKEHPNSGNAPTPTHTGFPSIHFQKIDCRTCHIPSVYAAPGKLKYRDWTVGWFRGLNRNQLDWNFNMLTGSHDPMPVLRAWITTSEGAKIAPVLPSVIPVWTEKLIINGEPKWVPTKTRDVANAAAIVKGKVNDGLLSGVNFTINGANVIPLFDGFQLADSLAIDTKADIDAMVAELSNSNGSGLAPHAALNDPKLGMLQLFFDPSHGVVPKEFALGGSMTGGCLACHSSTDPSSRNYSPLSTGFFERNQELLKYPLSQLADYDCDILVPAGMFPDIPTCKAYIGGQLMPGLGLSMDGIDFIQMMAIKEGDPDCNPMNQIFGLPTNCDDNDQDGWPDAMLTRDEARQRFATRLQQSTYNGSNRVVWNISVGKNPGNPAHQNTWDQATICYNPLTGQTMQCTDGGMILTIVNANQLLGYDQASLSKLTDPSTAGIPKPTAQFTYSRNGLTVNVKTSTTACSSSDCSYNWSFGDNTTASGLTASHTYQQAGTYTIKLTVFDNINKTQDIKSVSVSVSTSANQPPQAAWNITVNTNTWSVSITDQSTDPDNNLSRVHVNWGDGLSQYITPGGTVTHTYTNHGSYTITLTAQDSAGAKSSISQSVSFSRFKITGTVTSSGNPVAGASVKLYLGNTLLKSTTSLSNGSFSFSYLKPGTYTIKTSKTGYTFPDTEVTVGPNKTVTIQAQ